MNAESDSWVLVDVSYFKKYAANAAWRRYKSDNNAEDDPDFDPMTDRAYEDALSGYFNCQLSEIIQRIYPFHDRSHTIFCCDCPRNEIWRRDIFIGYKFRRDGAKERFSYSSINSWVDSWISNYTGIVGGHSFRVRNAEADDVIAILAEKLSVLSDETEILIISGDSDLLQLKKDNIFQVDCYGEEQTIEQKFQKEKLSLEPTASNYLKLKILTGDTSDDIPAVKPGKTGPKTSAKLLKEDGALLRFLNSEPSMAESFRRNYQLISLSCIPAEIRRAIEQAIEPVFQNRI